MPRPSVAVLSVAALAFLAGLPALAQAQREPEAVTVRGIAAGDLLNLRATASPTGIVLGRLPNGTPLVVEECERIGRYRWCRVEVEDGSELRGWTPARYLYDAGSDLTMDEALAAREPANGVAEGDGGAVAAMVPPEELGAELLAPRRSVGSGPDLTRTVLLSALAARKGPGADLLSAFEGREEAESIEATRATLTQSVAARVDPAAVELYTLAPAAAASEPAVEAAIPIPTPRPDPAAGPDQAVAALSPVAPPAADTTPRAAGPAAPAAAPAEDAEVAAAGRPGAAATSAPPPVVPPLETPAPSSGILAALDTAPAIPLAADATALLDPSRATPGPAAEPAIAALPAPSAAALPTPPAATIATPEPRPADVLATGYAAPAPAEPAPPGVLAALDRAPAAPLDPAPPAPPKPAPPGVLAALDRAPAAPLDLAAPAPAEPAPPGVLAALNRAPAAPLATAGSADPAAAASGRAAADAIVDRPAGPASLAPAEAARAGAAPARPVVVVAPAVPNAAGPAPADPAVAMVAPPAAPVVPVPAIAPIDPPGTARSGVPVVAQAGPAASWAPLVAGSLAQAAPPPAAQAFDATGAIPCARYLGQPMTRCEAGITRTGPDASDVTVNWPDGGTRVIRFREGQPEGANTRGEFRFTREADLHMIRVGTGERFEIPDALAFGE